MSKSLNTYTSNFEAFFEDCRYKVFIFGQCDLFIFPTFAIGLTANIKKHKNLYPVFEYQSTLISD